MSFSTIRNLIGILLGAISLVMLMTPALGVQFKPWFVDFLTELESWEVTLFIQFITPAVVAVIDYLNVTFDWHLKIADWWHHFFVLLWLLHSSMARYVRSGEGFAFSIPLLIWGCVTALVASAVTGTVPLNDPAIMFWPFAGTLLFSFAIGLSLNFRPPLASDIPSLEIGAGVLGLISIACAYSFWAFDSHNPMTTAWFGIQANSPGLVELAGFIAAGGSICFLLGLTPPITDYDPDGGGTMSVNNPLTNLGLDIVGAFGVAAFFAIIGLYLPG
jgi:hypothetical protein